MEIRILGHDLELDETLVIEESCRIREQLEEYRNGEREEFDLEIDFPDSFTGRTMRAINQVDYGSTRTYGEIAEKLNSSPVAVGQACSRNPVPVIVPCHRIVSKNCLGGYQYPGLKKKLLEIEGKNRSG